MPELPVVGDAPSKATDEVGKKSGSLKEALTKKYGPAPLWVYLIIGAVVAWFLFFRGGSKNAAGSGTASDASLFGGGGAGPAGGPPADTTHDPLGAVFAPLPAADLAATVWPDAPAATGNEPGGTDTQHNTTPPPIVDTSPTINPVSVPESGGAVFTDPNSTSVAPFQGVGVSTVGGTGQFGEELVQAGNLPESALPTTQLVGGVPISLSAEAVSRGGIAAKDIPQQPSAVGTTTSVPTEPAVTVA